MYFNKDRTRLAVISAPGRKGLRLGLSDYGLFDGNWVPSLLRLEGRGFLLQFKLSSMSITFDQGPAPTPAAANPAD